MRARSHEDRVWSRSGEHGDGHFRERRQLPRWDRVSTPGRPAPPPAYSGAPTAQVTKAASQRTRVALPAETRMPVTVMLGPSAKETDAL